MSFLNFIEPFSLNCPACARHASYMLRHAAAAIPPISQPMHCASGTGRAHTLAIWVAFGGVPGNPSRRDLPPTAPAGHGTLSTSSAGPIASELARHCAAHCPPCRQPQWAILGSLGSSRGVLSIPPSAGSACSRAGMGGPAPCRQRTCGGRGGARREGAQFFYALSSGTDQLEVVLGT